MRPVQINNQGVHIFLLLCLVGLAACAPALAPTQEAKEAIEIAAASVEVIVQVTEIAHSAIASVTESVCFQLFSPGLGSEIPNVGLVIFEWEDKEGASSYQLQMDLPNGNAEFFNSKTASLDKFMASLPLGGSYSWRVLAFDSGGEPLCFSDRFEFSKAQYEVEP